MALNVTNWVWEHSRAVNGALIVLLAIAHEAGRDGEAEMSAAELAGKCRLGERTVQTAVKELVSAGDLQVRHGGGRGRHSRYKVIMGNPAESAGFEAGNPAESAPFEETPQNLHPLEPPGNPAESAPFGEDHRRPDGTDTRKGAESAGFETSDVFRSTSTARSEVQAKEAPAVAERPDVERLCVHLASRIEANGCKRPVITKKWRDSARLMLDRDGRTEQQVITAIDWCQDHEFWRANILSMPKLREKYDQLRLQASRANGHPKSVTAQRVQQARQAGVRAGAILRGER